MFLSFKSKDDFISQAVMNMERKRLLELVSLTDLMETAGKVAVERAVYLLWQSHLQKYPGGHKKEKKHFVKQGEC
jgi:hypothetical protein